MEGGHPYPLCPCPGQVPRVGGGIRRSGCLIHPSIHPSIHPASHPWIDRSIHPRTTTRTLNLCLGHLPALPPGIRGWSFHPGNVSSQAPGTPLRGWSFHPGYVSGPAPGIPVRGWSFHPGYVSSPAPGTPSLPPVRVPRPLAPPVCLGPLPALPESSRRASGHPMLRGWSSHPGPACSPGPIPIALPVCLGPPPALPASARRAWGHPGIRGWLPPSLGLSSLEVRFSKTGFLKSCGRSLGDSM